MIACCDPSLCAVTLHADILPFVFDLDDDDGTMSEFAKFTAVMVPVSGNLVNRYSERKEKMKEGKLLTQAEKEDRNDLQKNVALAQK